jgi:hypothetical protein
MDRLNDNMRKFWTRVAPYFSWIIGIPIFAGTTYFVVTSFPNFVNYSDLSSDIALTTQVLSVLVGFAFVGATLYLSSYGVSDKVSTLLKNTTEHSDKLRRTYFDRYAEQRKIVNPKFIESLFNRTSISRLHFNNPDISGYSSVLLHN